MVKVLSLAYGWVSTQYEWYNQWDVLDHYKSPTGRIQRLPLRLHSHELVITGTADLDKVLPAFAEEYYTPVTVGGKAVVQVWMNNFTDTDCGPEEEKNPYLETWVNTFVTPKDEPLHLNYTSDFSYLIADPRSLIWIHRVLCGDAPGYPTDKTDPALEAILGGHNVWGFPKHKVKAEIETSYSPGKVDFEAEHLGKWAVRASVSLPENDPKVTHLPINIRTAADAVVSGPLYMVQQTRFGEAFNVTQHIAPWDASKDTLEFGHGEFYGAVIRGWDFEPKLKMHTDDFQIVAWKPSNWLPAKLGPKDVIV
jgi:hypothetical protein